eukprot:2787481-Amphidinium_carterae.1
MSRQNVVNTDALRMESIGRTCPSNQSSDLKAYLQSRVKGRLNLMLALAAAAPVSIPLQAAAYLP